MRSLVVAGFAVIEEQMPSYSVCSMDEAAQAHPSSMDFHQNGASLFGGGLGGLWCRGDG